MNIEWKEINPDYIVSSDGQIGSRKSGGLRMLKPRAAGKGYLAVGISAGGERRNCYVHRLVAEAFMGKPPTPKHEVNHKNGDRADNRDANLEWVTNSQNKRHRFDVLGHGNARGESQWFSKLTADKVRQIRARREAGDMLKDIARDFGLGTSHVSHLANRTAWAWLND